jgi:helicase
MEHLIVLEDSKFFLNPPGGKVRYKRPHTKPKEMDLIPATEVISDPPFPLLNPIQTLFFKAYDEGSSLISAPTSAGKSFIAFMFLKGREGRKVYTAPTKALVYEKGIELGRLFGRRVDLRTGDAIEAFKQSGSDIVVSTYENLALALRNKAPWAEEISAVVIDEIHHLMSSRGWIIEEIITSLLIKRLPILGLSATLPGTVELAKWMGAGLLIESFWRPVPLERKIIPLTKFGNGSKTKDPDERLARRLFSALFELKERQDQVILFVHKKSVGWKVLEVAEKEKVGIMNRTLPFEASPGKEPEIAFHNADIPREEREEIERSFRNGKLRVLVATHTLAYGVNLPADTVLIGVKAFFDRKEGKWKVFPGNLDILQMEGRAGRLGIKERGYSYILPYGAKPELLEREIDRSLNGELVPQLKRSLTEGNLDRDLERVLSLFVLIGILYEGGNFRDFLRRTFSLREYANDFYIDEIYDWLEERGYVDGGTLSDKAMFCVRSGMSPVDYEEFLRRKYIGSDRAVLIRPLLFVKRFEGLYEFVKEGETFIEDDIYIRDKLTAYGGECFEDNTHQFLFYIEGLTFKYRNIAQPPGEFSYLGTDALHLLRILLDIRSFGDISWTDVEIIGVAHMVKYGLTEEFSSLGGIKGIGHIRSNLLKRLMMREGINPPPLGSKVDDFLGILRDHFGDRLADALKEILYEERFRDDLQRSEQEASQVIKRIEGSKGGYLVDDRILRTFALFRIGPRAIRMRKEELIKEFLKD